MTKTVVIQVVDSLAAGGLESVGVNLCNALPRHGIHAYLCSTRSGGPLESRVLRPENYLNLRRVGLVDLKAVLKFNRFLSANGASIVHAHGTALFFCSLALRFKPRCRLVWHDHYGPNSESERPAWLYRLAVRRASGIIAVNHHLAEWARTRLAMPADRVWYIPNFVPDAGEESVMQNLPGEPGKRIVCVANIRPEKDHLTLVNAMSRVVLAEPEACLLLVGGTSNADYTGKVRERIAALGLNHHIHMLGGRSDVGAILSTCDIGVLSSASEGLPLAILEYGRGGLPTVASSVGQIPEVLDQGNSGRLVEPGNAIQLADSLLQLLGSSQDRILFGSRLRSRVNAMYSESAVISKVRAAYSSIMEGEGK